MVFTAILLPPGLMCLLLALGRYEEWLFRQPAPVRPARHARSRRHLSLVPSPGPRAPAHRSESGRRGLTDAA
ncbi:hypothetical protein [Streptomyces sp. NPDC051636]|uniref:hypothetical protein n=1 Tax=Streptomyces sp. NPDC051636 TaxID=3365663 RepID=UPI0037B8F3CD